MSMRLTLLALPLGLASCSSPADFAQATGADTEAAATTSVSATAKISNAKGVSMEEETELFSYHFAYPAAVAAIPALAGELEQRGGAAKAKMLADAEADRQAMQDGDFPYRQHSLSENWKVAANLPDWLSLTSEFGTYTGGAHGHYGVTSLVWDKQAGKAMEGNQMFVSPAALDRAISDRYCPALDRQREEKNGTPVDKTASGMFSDCPSVTELTVIPGSSSGKAFDRIGFYAGPYVAGSYAEGSYEITLPVDAKILGAVKPEYRSAFAARR